MTYDSTLDAEKVAHLIDTARSVRANAYIVGNGTKVGAAVFSTSGNVYAGCNVAHKFRSHDVHAEVNALTNMVASGGGDRAVAVVIASDRAFFSPCGACMDWIFELGGPDCRVIVTSMAVGVLNAPAKDLMPYYPH